MDDGYGVGLLQYIPFISVYTEQYTYMREVKQIKCRYLPSNLLMGAYSCRGWCIWLVYWLNGYRVGSQLSQIPYGGEEGFWVRAGEGGEYIMYSSGPV